MRVPVGADVVLPMVEHDARSIERLARVDRATLADASVGTSSAAFWAERAQWHGYLPGSGQCARVPGQPARSVVANGSASAVQIGRCHADALADGSACAFFRRPRQER